MSFKRVSAIIKSTWLLNKQWADAHSPLIFQLLKGDSSVAASIMGFDDFDDEIPNNNSAPTQLAKQVFAITCGTDLNKVPQGSIAHVDIDGPLFKAGDICSYGMEDYAELFYAIAAANNIAGVILDIDSPGGQVDGTATLADAIKKCTDIKPVFGFIDDGMACSAGYWILSACTEIYCSQPTDVAGSIGVYCTIADWNAYYASEGLPVQDIYATQSEAGKNIEYREVIAGKPEKMKADLDFVANIFINTVKKNRSGKISGTEWQTGAAYFAADALKIGLIDGIKSFDQIVLRANRFINQSKNTTMAFEKTLAVAQAESFAVVDEGFALSEEYLNAIESAMASREETVALLSTANEQLTALQATVAENAIVINNNAATIATQAAEITRLNGLVAKYGSAPSGSGTSLPINASTEAAAIKDEAKPLATSILSDEHPLNVMVDAITSAGYEKRSI